MSVCPYCSASLSANQKPAGKPEISSCRACMNPLIIEWSGANVVCRPVGAPRDIRQLAPEGSIGGAIFSELPGAMERLPVLPEVAQRILAMVNDPNVTMNELGQVVREDSVIAVKMMQLANSPVYGGLQEVRDLNMACARLGMKVICNAVQAIANSHLYKTQDPRLDTHMRNLWRHSVAVAHCASELAILLAVPRPESLFLAGLVHDIGKVVLLDIIARSPAGPLREVLASPGLLAEALEGFHGVTGLQVMQHWGLPAEFSVTTFCHHDPTLSPDEDLAPRVHIVALANAIARVEGFSMSGEAETLYLTSHASARYLNLNDIKLASLRVDLADTLEAILEAVTP